MEPIPFNTVIEHEQRFEAWLAAQPITPRADFVARTLERIHKEVALLAAAKAGDEAAIDTLLDRWLSEQPLSAPAEPEELVAGTRRAATYEEQIEARPPETSPRRIVPFPAWGRSLGGLAVAAATIVFIATVGLRPTSLVKHATEQPQLAQNETELPAPGAWAYQPAALARLNDSLTAGAALLDADNVDLLVSAEQNNGGVY